MVWISVVLVLVVLVAIGYELITQARTTQYKSAPLQVPLAQIFVAAYLS